MCQFYLIDLVLTYESYNLKIYLWCYIMHVLPCIKARAHQQRGRGNMEIERAQLGFSPVTALEKAYVTNYTNMYFDFQLVNDAMSETAKLVQELMYLFFRDNASLS